METGVSEGPTAQLAAFAASGTYDDLPPRVIDAVTFAVIDTLAVTVAGADAPAVRIVRKLADAARDGVTLVGQTGVADPATAALINGVAAHALDYDDVSFGASAHPSVSLLPPLLALGEARHASGRNLINAYAVGLQVAMALGRTMNPGHYAHGWHGTGTIGTMASTFACGRLVGLDADRIAVAAAIAASGAGGLRGNFGTDVKPYQVGNGGRNAVTAVLLAEAGLTGPPDILEAKHGFFEAYSPAGEAPHRLADGWRAPWAVLEPGITTKLFPSCASSHAAVAAVLALRAQGLRPEELGHLRAELTDIAAGNMRYPEPQTPLEAKFSLQYCAAVALRDGTLTLDHFTDEAIAAAPRQLMSRIEVRHDPTLSASYVWGAPRPSVVTVRTRSGETLVNRCDAPPGSPGTFSREMLHAKVRDCLGRGSLAIGADDLIATAERLPEVDDIGPLLRELAAPSPARRT